MAEPQRRATTEQQALQWRQADELRKLVWSTRWRLPPRTDDPDEKPRRLSGEARAAWWVLWWDLGLWRGGAVDVTAAQIAAAIGDSDSRGGRRAIEALADAGLVAIEAREKKFTGRYTIFMPDPRDVLRGRRQASDGQVNFLDDQADELDRLEAETEPGSSPVAGRVEACSAAAADVPSTPPVTNGRSVRSVGRHGLPPVGRAPPDAAEVAQHPPPDVAQEVAPQDLDLEVCAYTDLSLEDLRLLSASSSQTIQARNGGGCCTTSADPAATVVGDLLGQVLARIEGRRGIDLIASLSQIIPGLWGDWAEELARELDGGRDAEHGGEPTPLNMREVARMLVSTFTRKTRTKPDKVYFPGAVNLWLQEHGRRPIWIDPRKPR